MYTIYLFYSSQVLPGTQEAGIHFRLAGTQQQGSKEACVGNRGRSEVTEFEAERSSLLAVFGFKTLLV